MDDIVRALENGTVRDLHVRELDLSGTTPFPRRTAAPRAQLAPARNRCCNRRMWRPLAFSVVQVGG